MNDMPRCIQRDYLKLALEKIEAVTAALAAAPTIPATGADVRVGETLAERDRRIYAQGRKDACEEYGLDAGKVGTIPATGHAATEKTLSDVLDEARISLRVTDACLECNADDVQRWHDTIAWLESLA